MNRTIFSGTGSYIPPIIKTNSAFAVNDFYTEDHVKIETPPLEVAEKFRQITGIEERRYVPEGINASDIGTIAGKIAIEDSGIDPETIDQIIVAHNFGNVVKHTIQTDILPSLAARIKHDLQIKNPHCVAYDILFGCPGWLQGVIQADAFFKAGIAKRCLVIGTETLSRVLDIYDRDSMIFSDGAGASVLEFAETGESNRGILSTSVLSHAMDEAYFLYLGKSNFPQSDPRIRYIKMRGRKVYEYAMKYVPEAMKECLDNAGADIQDIKKVFIHQANEKMDEGITKALYKLYAIKEIPEHIMPMSIHKLGNSSVATIPTLLDMVRKNKLDDQHLNPGDLILFASVGAGMNINAVCYRI